MNNEASIVQQLERVKSADYSSSNCRQVFENIQTLIQQLKSLGRDITEDDDPLWKQLIYKKFPASIRKKVFLKMQENNNIWTVKQMLDNIDKLITSTEMYEEDRNEIICIQVNPIVPTTLHYGIIFHKRYYVDSVNATGTETQNVTFTALLQNEGTLLTQVDNVQEKIVLNADRITIAYYAWDALQLHPQHTNEQRQVSASQNSNIANNSLNHADASENSSLRQNILMTADAEIWNHNTNQFERLIILFDSGSHLSFIQESHAKYLKLATSGSTRVTLSGLGGCTGSFNSNTAPVRFRTSIGQILNIQLLTKLLISNSFQSATVAKQDLQFLQQLNVTLSNPRISGEVIQPRILIGLDLWVEFMKVTNAIIVVPSGLLLQPTMFGYCIHNLSVIKEEDSSSRKELNRIYSLEGLGIFDDPTNQEDETFEYMEKYSKGIKYTKEGVVDPFPFKESIVNLKDNFNIAYRRLTNLIESLRSKPDQVDWYHKILKAYADEGIIELANESIPQRAGTFYLLHRGVWKPEKATPLRIVFDASQKSRSSPSLNDCIYKALSFINKIQKILIAARWGKIMITADIQAAFVQIRIPEEHKDLTRFLWVKDTEKPLDRSNIQIFRFTR
uniref:DUF1758 domain-containing protein n=1 Tax=Heterorhabditis bacteriophora TaxID=37862 RepID=A0A1I7WWM3_HETBA